jgi:hypothetical protein
MYKANSSWGKAQEEEEQKEVLISKFLLEFVKKQILKLTQKE